MKNKIIAMLIGICLVSFTSAMFAGDSITFETNLTNPIYTVVGNSSDLEGLNMSFENGNITISTVINYKPDNFTLIFFENQTNTEYVDVEKIIYRGGGSSTRYKDKIVIQNQTIYVPEYVDKIVEIEKIVKVNDTYIPTGEEDDGYKLWQVLLGMLLGIIFGLYIVLPSAKLVKKEDNQTKSDRRKNGREKR